MDRGVVERYRLALFGRMVPGVAHEVDNHLAVVMGFSELMQFSAANEAKVRDGAGKILGGAEKINRIVKQFAGYVRPHDGRAETFPVSEMLSEVMLFAKYDLGRSGVAVTFPDQPSTGLAVCDRRDLALALLCLCFNASEAMASSGGTLDISFTVEGGFAVIRVLDNGPGFGDVPAERLFEPGYTTKAASVHEGVGLPVARAIAEAAGGSVTVTARAEGGCEAVLKVPGK